MKIICVGRNYADHIAELNNERPDEPVIFTKPDTAISRGNADFYIPEFTKEVHYELEIILRIGKNGKYIEPKYADRYIDAMGLGIDFTARDLQQKAKTKGLPWALAKGFDGSAPISEWVPIQEFTDWKNIHFHLDVNGDRKQDGHTALMLWSFQELVSYISTFITLRMGDIIFTGTPAGVGPVTSGDRLCGYLENTKLLDFEVR